MIHVALYVGLCLLAGIFGQNRRIGFFGGIVSAILFTPFLTIFFLIISAPSKSPV